MYIATAQPDSTRKKVAVVLSGGGAKGVAHIGVLQVLEDAGIHVDYVVGTSMGAIIGGLYSIGYSPQSLDSLVRAQNWEWLLSDKPKPTNRTFAEVDVEKSYVLSRPIMFKNGPLAASDGFIRGENLNGMFSKLTIGYHDSINFLTLPKPFTCIATDITMGDEVILNSGVLPEAMRASMAIPGVFSPVRKNDMILVDGGLVNNFPADVARRMGADIVIGVDVQAEFHKNDTLRSIPSIAGRIIDIACRNKFEDNLKLTDLYIKVDVEGYSSASFNHEAIDSLIKRGYSAAMGKIGQIDSLAASLAPQKEEAQKCWNENQKIFVRSIQFECNKGVDVEKLLKKCNLRERSFVDIADIDFALGELSSKLNFSSVNYRLYQQPDSSYRLKFLLKMGNNSMVNLGIRFDSEEVVSLLMNTRTKLFSGIPEISITGRLGKQYMGNLKYIINTSPLSNFGISYTYWYHDIDINQNGKRICNVVYSYHDVELGYENMRFNNFRILVGAGLEIYHNLDILHRSPEIFGSDLSSSYHFLKYIIRTDFNNQNQMYYPTRGIRFGAQGTVYTDNAIQYKDHDPFYAVSAMFTCAIPLSKRFTFEPSTYGRLVEGSDVPKFYLNAFGGESPARYFQQQIPFTGIGRVEMTDDVLLAVYAKFRYEFSNRHYISLISNMAFSNTCIGQLFTDELVYGVGLCYSYNSLLGPLELSASYSNRTDRLFGYLNLGFYF